jgi:hypothetical protein
VLTRAVLRYPGYDWFLDGLRSTYLSELLEISSCVEDALTVIDRALPKTRRRGNAEHLINLARCLGQRGHAGARDVLREAFLQGRADDEFFAADVVIELEGVDGFLFVIGNLGERLRPERGDKLRGLLFHLDPDARQEDVREAIKQMTSRNELIATYLQCLPPPKRYREPRPLPQMSFAEFMARVKRAEKTGRTPANLRPWQWRKSALLSEYRIAARTLEETHDYDQIRKLVRVVNKESYLLPIRKLAHRIKTESRDNGYFLVQALEDTHRSSVRRLAFGLFEDEERWVLGTGLLRANFRKGDEAVLLDLLHGRGSAAGHWVHGPVTDIISLCHAYPKVDWVPHLLWMYEHNPCAECRGSAVWRLIELGRAPREMLEECLFDSQLDTREEARKALAGPSLDVG